MAGGALTMNGITDRELVIILEVKEKHEGKMIFNPQQMQPQNQQPSGKQTYNNVMLNWQEHSGLKGVLTILERLSAEEPKQ
jgi:hypothetical protein